MFCLHHFHQMGVATFAQCGMPLQYAWECCRCGRKGTTVYETVGPGLRGTSVSPYEEERHRRKMEQAAQ